VGRVRVRVQLKFKPGSQDIDQAAIEQLRYSPGVQRDIHRRADNVANYMRANVGVKTGELRSTIRTEDDGADVNVMAGRAGATPQLGYQMNGTSPHVIRPKGTGYPLRFFWEKVGQNVAFMKVNHPGGKKNDFVRESIRAAAP
jgi:hypothetical protein